MMRKVQKVVVIILLLVLTLGVFERLVVPALAKGKYPALLFVSVANDWDVYLRKYIKTVLLPNNIHADYCQFKDLNEKKLSQFNTVIIIHPHRKNQGQTRQTRRRAGTILISLKATITVGIT